MSEISAKYHCLTLYQTPSWLNDPDGKKGGNDGHKYFLLFPAYFFNYPRASFNIYNTLKFLSASVYQLDESIIVSVDEALRRKHQDPYLPTIL